jgi:hypothetical protein
MVPRLFLQAQERLEHNAAAAFDETAYPTAS